MAARSTKARAAVLRARAGKEGAARGRWGSELGFVRVVRGGVAIDLKERGAPDGRPVAIFGHGRGARVQRDGGEQEKGKGLSGPCFRLMGHRA